MTAKVNGRLVPLDTVLRSADVVEIVTSKYDNAGPSRDWLNIAASSGVRPVTSSRALARRSFGNFARRASICLWRSSSS